MRNRTENQVTLALIRHGETDANRERRYLGRTDEPLSEDGIMTLASYKRQNCYPDVECLFSSPMKRCLQTAAILYPHLQPMIIPEWTEMDFGEFEYRNYVDLGGDARYQSWIDSGGTLAFPGGEDRKDFTVRCGRGFSRVCDVLRRETDVGAGKTVRAAAVVHGGTIMALMSAHDPARYFDYQTANGKGYLCRVEGLAGCGCPIRLREVGTL